MSDVNVKDHITQIKSMYHLAIDMLIAADEELRNVVLTQADPATIKCYQEAYSRANDNFLKMEKLMMEALNAE